MSFKYGEFLDKEVGYLDSEETATVFEHIIEGIDYVLTQRGEKRWNR